MAGDVTYIHIQNIRIFAAKLQVEIQELFLNPALPALMIYRAAPALFLIQIEQFKMSLEQP
jgi:hypothetical protein